MNKGVLEFVEILKLQRLDHKHTSTGTRKLNATKFIPVNEPGTGDQKDIQSHCILAGFESQSITHNCAQPDEAVDTN